MSDSLLSLALAFALVGVNGVFVAAEFAIVRVRRTRLEELVGLGHARATEAIELVDKMADYLTTTQIGVTATSLGVGWLGESAFSRLIAGVLPEGNDALAHLLAGGAAFLVVTFVHVVLGEIVPKNLAVVHADRYLIALAPPLRILHRVLRPLSVAFTAVAGAVQRVLGHRERTPSPLSEHELKLVMMDSHEDGVLTRGEASIILRAFEFADKHASEIMTPAEDVDYVSLSRTFEENLAVARAHMHTHVPLCRTGLDSAYALVSVLDVLFRFESSNEAFERAAKPLLEVPADLSQEEVLRRLKVSGAHLVVVRAAPARRVLGVVTLENVLGSLVAGVAEP
ncbi:MAG: HlyC/CorC family transporter [Labilithrix sp.]|nr:HlyC/CorC family transporter [Labilithrix sp.]MCW5817282.1 HlyC/CorC family transporter [Labilithrix sp.]